MDIAPKILMYLLNHLGYESNREICENSHESTPTYADTLYDLIQADLVEKVENKWL